MSSGPDVRGILAALARQPDRTPEQRQAYRLQAANLSGVHGRVPKPRRPRDAERGRRARQAREQARDELGRFC